MTQHITHRYDFCKIGSSGWFSAVTRNRCNSAVCQITRGKPNLSKHNHNNPDEHGGRDND